MRGEQARRAPVRLLRVAAAAALEDQSSNPNRQHGTCNSKHHWIHGLAAPF
jgi:hypothetical protein